MTDKPDFDVRRAFVPSSVFVVEWPFTHHRAKFIFIASRLTHNLHHMSGLGDQRRAHLCHLATFYLASTSSLKYAMTCCPRALSSINGTNRGNGALLRINEKSGHSPEYDDGEQGANFPYLSAYQGPKRRHFSFTTLWRCGVPFLRKISAITRSKRVFFFIVGKKNVQSYCHDAREKSR